MYAYKSNSFRLNRHSLLNDNSDKRIAFLIARFLIYFPALYALYCLLIIYNSKDLTEGNCRVVVVVVVYLWIRGHIRLSGNKRVDVAVWTVIYWPCERRCRPTVANKEPIPAKVKTANGSRINALF